MRLTLQSIDLTSRAKQARRQAVGASAEQIVERMATFCSDLRLGRLKKRPTNVVVSQGKAIYTGTAGCDFTGHLRGGRAIYCEVKHCQDPRLDLKIVRPSQRQELTEALADGAAAVVVVLIGPIGVHWTSVLPWRVCAEALAAGQKSIPFPVLQAWTLSPLTPLLQARAIVEVTRD
jgi:hypothetical protein